MPGLPFNSMAADARSAIMSTLGSWTALVADERHVTRPRRAVRPMAAFLSAHADWLAQHPAAGDISAEIWAVTRSARRACSGADSRRVPLGSCVEAGCAGELVAVLRAAPPARPARITCSTDPGHSWLPDQWLALSRRLGGRPAGRGVRWLTAAQVARLWDLAPGSVYRLASEHRWRRLSQAGRAYYHSGDVQDTLQRPAAAAV